MKVGTDQNGANVYVGTVLKGTFTLASNVKGGYWSPRNITVIDLAGNVRNEGPDDFGWRMYVNSPNEDTTPPEYVPNSMSLVLGSITTSALPDLINVLKSSDNQSVQTITAKWLVVDEMLLGDTNQVMGNNWECYGTLNDEIAGNYSFPSYGSAVSNSECQLTWYMPEYMPSSTYHLNYITIRDKAMNETSVYFTGPEGLDLNPNNIDEMAANVTLTTSTPDTAYPELDLNSIVVNAAPTNPSEPNGQTLVTITFKVKDNLSGYHTGSLYLRDPQGLSTQFYHYPPNRNEIFPQPGDTDWKFHTATKLLPVGSAPGTWGLVEMNVEDRAGNFKTHDFTETITFSVLE